MLELSLLSFSAVEFHATPAACDRVAGSGVAAGPLGTARIGRVAPDELLVLGKPGEAFAILTAAMGIASTLDPGAFGLEGTDGWTAWSLRGASARDVFAYLSEVELPEGDGFGQGDVVHVAVKIATTGVDMIDLFVPAYWGPYVRERILTAGAAFAIREVSAR